MVSLVGKLAAGCGVIIAGMIGAVIIDENVGDRRVKNVYEFTYQGKPALVRQEDRLIGVDPYPILLNGRDRINEGTLITDDGKKVVISSNRFKLYERKESWEGIK